MKLHLSASQGMTLMELLIALALGAGLSAVLMQLFTTGMRLQAMQNAEQDLQQRAAYAQFLLRAAIRESASPCAADDSGPWVAGYPALTVLAPQEATVNAVVGSAVMRVRTGDCEAPVDFYYLSRGAGDMDSPIGLYRRRQNSDESYAQSEELIEGVTSMTASMGIELPASPSTQAVMTRVAYVDADQVDDWSRVFSISLALSVRQVSATGDLTHDELTLVFNTALRQHDPHTPGQVAE